MFENSFGAQLWKCSESGSSKELLDIVKMECWVLSPVNESGRPLLWLPAGNPPFQPCDPWNLSSASVSLLSASSVREHIYSFCLPGRLDRSVVVALCSGHLGN